MKQQYIVRDINDYQDLIDELLSHPQAPLLILLTGDLGAGKTTFVSQVAQALNTIDSPSSPTYAIANEYLLESGSSLYHLDCYRLDSAEEAFEAGLDQYISSSSWCFVEWPEVIRPLIDRPYLDIRFQTAEDQSRIISVIKE